MSQDNVKTEAELWDSTVKIFRASLKSPDDVRRAERHFDMFLSHNLVGDTLRITVMVEDLVGRFTDLYSQSLELALEDAGRPGIHVVFAVDDKASEQTPSVFQPAPAPQPIEPPRPAVRAEAPKAVASSTLPIDPSFTFENFVDGPSNSFALATAKAVAKRPGVGNYKTLFIWGSTGLGKTHLMQAIGNRVLERLPGKSVCYITAEILLNKFVEAIANHSVDEFRARYRSYDVLLVDDVQFIAGKEQIQEEFFNTYNQLMIYDKQIVMTCDVSPKDLKGLEDRLSSRFMQGIVVEIESPSYETRLAILNLKAQGMRHKLPEDIQRYIAENIKSHVRALEGALMLVMTFMDANPDIPVTEEVAHRLLKDLIVKEQTMKNLSVEDIISAVCTKYNVTEKEIKSLERTQPLATARQVAMFLSTKLTNYSLQAIGNCFDKNHSTILHGARSIKKRYETENDLRAILEEITAELGRKPSELK